MISLLYIGNKLADKNGTVTAIDTLGKSLEKEGFKVKYASSFSNKLFRVVHMLWAVFRYRSQVNYALLDTYSTLNFYYAYLVSQLCRVFRIRYIPILHGGNLPNRFKTNPRLASAIFNHAYVNIAPSEYTKQSFNNSNIKNVICIPNTIEIENYNFHSKTVSSIKLLWVRSFSVIYNPKLAVDILYELKKIYIDVSLTMVGPEKDGSLNKTKKYAMSKGVEVNFTGKLSKKEWLSIACDHNIFINTTNFDNMPVSVIEAMALGLPVISTNVGGMPFLIESGKDGLLVPPNDAGAFVEVIKDLKNDYSLLKALTKNARAKAENYSWSIIKNDWLKVLE